jgi:hypothetical protein
MKVDGGGGKGGRGSKIVSKLQTLISCSIYALCSTGHLHLRTHQCDKYQTKLSSAHSLVAFELFVDVVGCLLS